MSLPIGFWVLPASLTGGGDCLSYISLNILFTIQIYANIMPTKQTLKKA